MGSKARDGAKAMSRAFELLDFQHAGVRRRSVDMQQFGEVSRTRTTYSIYLIRSEMGSQCSFSRRGVEWEASAFLKWEANAVFPEEVLGGGDGVPREQVLQQSSEFSGEVE